MEIITANIKLIVVIMAISLTISVNVIKKLIVKSQERPIYGSRRMMQLNEFTHSNAVKERMNEYIGKNIKYEKRTKLQKLLIQSGLGITVVDFVLISIFTGICLAISLGALLNNMLVFIVGLLIGFYLPTQIIQFIRNRRVMKLDTQIASFIRMTVKRYYITGQLSTSIEMTLSDFGGQEPISTEIKKTILDIEVGSSAIEALEGMEKRTQNEYLKLFTSNLRASADIGTEKMKQRLLDSVIDKFDEDIKLSSKLKKEISSPVMEGFLMMLIVPATFIMQASSDDTYVPFMRNDPMGKMAMAFAVALMFCSAWLLINKVGAPLDKEEK